ncbi:HdeD family acid-resistance protein [Niabella sp. CC-SYL272]|uniref:HdeD family acid-resistance protein n=1 Tax=Niabella agricola TaxID=2891571 RepID=UPI001F168328|nr:HdeD family acid-resistance protein [Niabella agricola]MCF3111274.1 HdeD family acid-resistance protein [Niabella agricola]
MTTTLLEERLKNWWLLLVSGILFVLLALYIFSQPLASYVALSVLFASTFIVAGAFEILYAVSSRKHDQGWGWSLFGGIVDLLFGIFLLSSPMLTMAALPTYIGIVILFRSLLGVFYAFSLKKAVVKGWGGVLFMAIMGMLFALLMIGNPVFGGLTIIIYTAVSFLMLGIVQIVLSMRLRKLKKRLES